MGNRYCSMQLSDKCKKDSGVREEKNFYLSTNDNFFKSDKMHICKDCMKEYAYVNEEVDLVRLKRLLRVLDLPFLKQEFESAVKAKSETIGMYIKNISFNHKGKGWDEGEQDKLKEAILETNENVDVEKEMIMFWGKGFDAEQYEFLEVELANWKKTHKCDNQSELTLLKEICIKILEIRKSREENRDAGKLQKDLQDLMKTASVDPAKANAITTNDSVEAFGVWIKDIEKKRPAEWHEEQEKYVDMDGFKGYIKDYIVRPIKNFFTGNKDFIVNGEDYGFNEEEQDNGIDEGEN